MKARTIFSIGVVFFAAIQFAFGDWRHRYSASGIGAA